MVAPKPVVDEDKTFNELLTNPILLGLIGGGAVVLEEQEVDEVASHLAALTTMTSSATPASRAANPMDANMNAARKSIIGVTSGSFQIEGVPEDPSF